MGEWEGEWGPSKAKGYHKNLNLRNRIRGDICKYLMYNIKK